METAMFAIELILISVLCGFGLVIGGRSGWDAYIALDRLGTHLVQKARLWKRRE